MTEQELRKTMSEADYLKHYEAMIREKEAKGLPLLPFEEVILDAIKAGHGLSLVAIEIVENLGD